MPSTLHQHIEKLQKSNYFGVNKIDTLELNIMRYNLAIEHTNFINLNKYPICKKLHYY